MVWPERVCISVHEGDWRSAVLCLIEIKPRENCIIRKFYLIKSGIYRKSVHSGKRNHNWNRYQEYFFGALIHNNILCCCSVVQSLSHVWVFVTPWTAACQSSLSFTISQSLLDSCPLSRWCHPTISSSFFSPYLQSFPESGSFPTSQLFTSSGQSVGASASVSVLPMSILLHICFLLYQFLSLSFWFLFFYLGLLYCPFTNFMRQMLSFLISSFLFCNEYPTFPSENGPCCSLWLS